MDMSSEIPNDQPIKKEKYNTNVKVMVSSVDFKFILKSDFDEFMECSHE